MDKEIDILKELINKIIEIIEEERRQRGLKIGGEICLKMPDHEKEDIAQVFYHF